MYCFHTEELTSYLDKVHPVHSGLLVTGSCDVLSADGMPFFRPTGTLQVVEWLWKINVMGQEVQGHTKQERVCSKAAICRLASL